MLQRHGIDVLGIATHGEQATSAASLGVPDVIVLCIWGRRILQDSSEARALSVFASGDPQAVHEAMRAGFQEYLAKQSPPPGLLASLRKASASDNANPWPRWEPAANGRLLDKTYQATDAEHLSPRERQVLALLLEGASTKDMARLLSVRPNTARTHVQNVLAKLQVHSRLEAVTVAVRSGLIEPPARSPQGTATDVRLPVSSMAVPVA
jgi:DNA-binding NarL/FixJ family response regulator